MFNPLKWFTHCHVCGQRVTMRDVTLINQRAQTGNIKESGAMVRTLFGPTICYACMLNKIDKKPVAHRIAHIEGNAYCPCGSGKKYKKCCQSIDKAGKHDG